MSFNVEFTRRVEGLADQSSYGFGNARYAKTTNPRGALELASSYNFDLVFASYAERRTQILSTLAE